MRIACPTCNATYEVPDVQLGEGRVVRCVRCGTDWSPMVAVPAGDAAPVRAEAAEAVPETTSEVAPAVTEAAEAAEPAPVRRMALDDDPVVTVAPMAAAAVPAAARRGGPWLAIAWVLSVVAVAGGVAALVVWREAVMHAWPPSVRAYAAVGLLGRP